MCRCMLVWSLTWGCVYLLCRTCHRWGTSGCDWVWESFCLNNKVYFCHLSYVLRFWVKDPLENKMIFISVKVKGCTYCTSMEIKHHYSNKDITLMFKMQRVPPFKLLTEVHFIPFQGFVVSLLLDRCSSYLKWQPYCICINTYTDWVYSWVWTPRLCEAEWILLQWGKQQGSTPLPLFHSIRLAHFSGLYTNIMCVWKKKNGWRNK